MCLATHLRYFNPFVFFSSNASHTTDRIKKPSTLLSFDTSSLFLTHRRLRTFAKLRRTPVQMEFVPQQRRRPNVCPSGP